MLIALRHGVQVVVECCAMALRAGVRSGMTLAHARALLERDDCRIEPFEPQRQDRALHQLALWAMRYSPWVSPDPPSGVLIDITGCQQVFGGEARLLERIRRELDGLGFESRAAAAPTFGCAWALARFGPSPQCIVETGHERLALAPLPAPALRLDEQTIAALHEVEITRIGHLLELPRSSLAARFGQELLLRLDQALGMAFETIEPLRPGAPLMAERAFDGPTTQLEAIEITIRQLLEVLCADLLKQESGVRRLDVKLLRIDETPMRASIALSRPSRNPRHLWTLLQPKIEKINLGFGVEHITVIALRAATLAHQQTEQWADGRGGADKKTLEPAIGEMIDALSGRLGSRAVMQLEPVESHIPEMASRLRPVLEISALQTVSNAAVMPADRPTLLLSPPELARITMAAMGLPLRLRWRAVDCSIVSWIGPERIAPAWWNGAPGPGDGAPPGSGDRGGGTRITSSFRMKPDAGCGPFANWKPADGSSMACGRDCMTCGESHA